MPPSSHAPFGNGGVSQWAASPFTGQQQPSASIWQPSDAEHEAVGVYGSRNGEYSSTTPIPRSSFFEVGSRYSNSEQQPLFGSPNSRGSSSFGSGRGSLAAQQSQQSRFAVNCTELELGRRSSTALRAMQITISLRIVCTIAEPDGEESP